MKMASKKSEIFTKMILIILVLLADQTQPSKKIRSSIDVFKKLGKAIQSKSVNLSLTLLDKHYFTKIKGIFELYFYKLHVCRQDMSTL